MTPRPLWIRGARLVGPGRDDAVASLHVSGDGRIAGIAAGTPQPPADAVVWDAAGLVLMPGWWDMHVHLRDPGLTYKEDIASGTRCAVASGVTAVVALANTDPVNDHPEVTRYVLARAAEVGYCRVLPVSAATMGLRGEELAPYHQQREAGCVAVSDDGATVPTAGVMRRVLEYAATMGMPVLPHCEDRSLRAGGVMNAGPTAVALGLPGNPREAEEVCLARDIHLARLTGAHLHVQHVTTARGVAMVRRAKDEGIAISAEVCPHHLFLTDRAVVEHGTNAKMAPPLRGDEDVAALRAGLRDGTLDVYATDHAPHAPFEKEVPFEAAPDGIIGLETSLPLALRLVDEGVLDWRTLLERTVAGPRRILGAATDPWATGGPADFALVDPGVVWTYEARRGLSRSRNSPFDGWAFKGRVTATWVGGVLRWDLDERGGALGLPTIAGVAAR